MILGMGNIAGPGMSLADFFQQTEPWSAAGIFNVNDIIDPAETRDWLITMLEYHYNYRSNGVGQHMMHCWPTSY